MAANPTEFQSECLARLEPTRRCCSRQTMSESVLVAGWVGFASYACHEQSSIAETMGFSV